jgi:hypothetical protein
MMHFSGAGDNKRYLFFIAQQGDVSRVEIDWPVFIGKYFAIRIDSEGQMNLHLEGNGLVGLSLGAVPAME